MATCSHCLHWAGQPPRSLPFYDRDLSTAFSFSASGICTGGWGLTEPCCRERDRKGPEGGCRTLPHAGQNDLKTRLVSSSPLAPPPSTTTERMMWGREGPWSPPGRWAGSRFRSPEWGTWWARTKGASPAPRRQRRGYLRSVFQKECSLQEEARHKCTRLSRRRQTERHHLPLPEAAGQSKAVEKCGVPSSKGQQGAHSNSKRLCPNAQAARTGGRKPQQAEPRSTALRLAPRVA